MLRAFLYMIVIIIVLIVHTLVLRSFNKTPQDQFLREPILWALSTSTRTEFYRSLNSV
jgi:hypothetical protein